MFLGCLVDDDSDAWPDLVFVGGVSGVSLRLFGWCLGVDVVTRGRRVYCGLIGSCCDACCGYSVGVLAWVILVGCLCGCWCGCMGGWFDPSAEIVVVGYFIIVGGEFRLICCGETLIESFHIGKCSHWK
ncbi:hypothetical protein Droror1_Dr00018647 [Drosera rotundifolia]